MNFQEKSKEELINELLDLQQKYNSVVALYDKKIEESRQTEKTLHENEANIKAIIENSLESVWTIDTNYNIQYVNEIFTTSFQQTFGVLLEKGDNILESLPPQLRTIWKERYDRAFKNEHFVFTDNIELENGSIYIEVAMNPVVMDDKVVGASFFGKNITEQKQAETAFWESQVNFKALFEKGPIGVAYHRMIYDELGKPVDYFFLDANQSYQKLTGVNPVGKRVTEAFPGIENDPFDWIGTFGEVAKTGKEIRLQQYLQLNDKWYDCVAYQYKPDHFVVAFFDITEQKRVEIALKESEAIFSHFMENSPVYIFFKDKNIRALRLSKNFEQLIGKPLNEIIGKTMDELFPSELAKKMIADDKKILSDRTLAVIDEELNGRFYTTIKFPIIIDNEPQYLAGYTIDITERKLAEDTLRSSEERLKILFNYAPEAYYLSDLKGNFVDGNIAAEKLLGYDKNELIGKNLFNLKLLSSKQLFKASKLLALSLLGKPTGPDEFTLNRKDGSKVTVEITTHPVKIKGQTLVLGIARDVSERKRAEKAMKQASENWNRTFQAMHSGIALLDANQKIIQTNRAFQNFVNSKEANLLGKLCFPFIIGKEFPAESNPFEKMIKSKTCETTETVINGRICEVLVDPILDSDEIITGAVLIMNDISQRKRDENIQQILHEITGTSMFEKSIGDLLVIVRKELSKVLDTTNFFVALYQPDTDTLRKVIFEDEKDDFVEWDARKSLSGQILKLGKPLLLNSEEEAGFAAKHNIELLGSPAACWLGVPLMSGEKPIGVMVVQSYTDENAYDIAAIRLLILIAHELSIIIERKKMIHDLVAAKERAEESDRLKSAFLANMSHEIRTPMNGILGFAELLREPKLSGEEQQMFIDIIEKSGERMLNIINDLINISKIESGQMDVHFSETNINEQLEFLYNFFKLEANQKGLKLVVSYPHSAEHTNIRTDKEKVYAILTNLIKNAIKFTKSGTIEFGYQVAENKLIFYIKDTGIGIPQNKQRTIFERFVQANTGMASVYEGAGLGLAISKAYVEMLGGKIWIESEQGKGTCFYFTLPASLKTETEPAIDKELIVSVENENIEVTILIAEDDEISLMYLNHILKNSYLKILVAKTGAEVVDLCRNQQNIELVLMDINMPIIDGDIAARIIKEFRPDLPIIAQTAFALDEDKEKYSDAFDDYITKPIKADELKQKIRKYLKRADI